MSDTADAFWSRVTKTDRCWLWTGHIGRIGYGRLGIRLAHRIAYELLAGPIPEGLTIDHLCRVRHCVNPDHLEPVTNRVNTLRGVGFAAKNSRKTHCPQGHAYEGRNSRGERRCLACNRTQKRQYRQNHKAAANV